MKIRPYVLGYSAYAREIYYKCKKCRCEFSSWDIEQQKDNRNGTKEYCPKCEVELLLPL